ncbi:hypothetical protein FDI23_gp268 [Serratia phage CHI14]|uniref:Uncharacterized protein n=2 Tax=Winklervirus chi14 TaxID=2560752 RepID=A0A1Z1LYG2_9CAUD|nr:hypothetical protein FDI23_gp268 [Serratia phage CHI14]ARW57570.1 hypothetical protein [Serratia phage CHI14]ARW57845.1 hypothetical protein [Serratia phage CBH8]
MQKINELFLKAKTWFNKNYEIPDELGKWDYAILGMATGSVLLVINSFILSVLVGLFMLHKAWERKDV